MARCVQKCRRRHQRELLAGSAQLAKLNDLQSASAAPKAKADAKTAELNRAFAEFNALPDKAARLQHQLTNCALEREVLDETNLIGKIKINYRKCIVTGNHGRKADADHFSAVLQSRPVKIEVLDDLESELRSQLKLLDRRNVELAKILAIKRHTLN